MSAPINLRNSIVESHDEYHARSGEYLSSHLLAAFRRCPREYQMRVRGEITVPDSAALRFGRAFHCLALEGDEAFASEYLIGGPINPKTGKPFGADTKAARAAEEESGKAIVEVEDYGTMCAMDGALREHAVAQSVLHGTIREAVFRTNLQGVKCQARCDAVSESAIADLKTTDDIDSFERDAKKYGYLHQLAFYADVASFGNARSVTCYLIACEKRAPYRVGVWEMLLTPIDSAAAENRSAIRRLKAMMPGDASWPTGYEERRVFTG